MELATHTVSSGTYHHWHLEPEGDLCALHLGGSNPIIFSRRTIHEGCVVLGMLSNGDRAECRVAAGRIFLDVQDSTFRSLLKWASGSSLVLRRVT